ncbi:ATP-binding cassette domain-containing protein [Tsukamurella paurometabola]|uniref:ATP-binding cassette domain-containing protein n=1 Tax=Tsukamurella paurometabola TaxID=2061 RepID=A0ABS5NKD5_TSUPA|nr:ATP-binding cassette domain-containing protein [Tsukamurella paurometabola]MBS4104077.1 ATP-binding cassette domain-containing protein [Tsukamurella paurometabola]
MGRAMTRRTRTELLGSIGSLIESPPGYAHLTGAENMRVVQRMLDLDRPQVDWAIDAVRLRDHLDRKVREYSLGMKQRLGIAMALARRPALLILDEPTNGLDPAGIEEMRILLRRLANGGVTVLVSSHLLGEVDRTADALGILSEGRLIFQGTRAQLLAASTPDVIIACTDPRAATAALAAHGAHATANGEVSVPGIDDHATARVVARLVGEGIGIHGVRREEQSLEDVFLRLTAEGAL